MKPIENTQEPSSSSCDLNIIVEGKQYGAHWCILREKSKFFDEFYRRKLKAKKKSSDGAKTCVHLEGISSELVGLFLQYVYMNSSKYEKPENIELNEINNVLKFSVMFGLKDLEMAKSKNLEAPVKAIDKSNRMSQLHKNLLKFLYLRTTGYKTGDIAKFVAHKAYTAANMECLFEVLKIVSCNSEKIEMRLGLLDILITLFSASLDQEVIEVDKKGHEEILKECKGYESNEFGTGKSKNTPLLRAGLINETANPQRTGAKPKRLMDHQESSTKRKVLFYQNSRKMNKNNNIERQNTNTIKISKAVECQRKANQNFINKGKSPHQRNNCPTTNSSKQQRSSSKPMKTQRSPANRRITLIKEHLERINEYIERANAHDKRVHERSTLVDSRIPQSKPIRSNGETKRAENKFSRVDMLKNRFVKQVVRAGDKDKRVYFSFSPEGHVLSGEENGITEERHALGDNEQVVSGEENVLSDEERVLCEEEHILGDEEHDMLVQGNSDRADVHRHVNNSTLSREYKDVACDTGIIKYEKNCEILVANMSENKNRLGNEQEPRIIKRKIRKMWTKDFNTNFSIIESQEGKSAYNKINPDQNPQSACKETSPNQNFEIQQQPLKCEEIAREIIYITGGIQKNDYFAHKAILELNPETKYYTTRGAMHTGRYNHGMAQLGNEIYLVGGNSGFFEQLRGVESYSPEHEQWTIKPSMREARDEFSLAVCDGCLYAIGGHNGIQDLRSVEKFSARENSWSFVSPMRNYRAGACAVCVDDRSIYVIGGFNGQTYLTCVEQYDVTADVWIEIQPINNKRAYSCTVLFERGIYIFGGFDGQVALSSCEMYDIEAGIWKILPDMNTPRMNATAVVYSGGVFVLGGECDSVFLETVEYYNMKNKTWSFVQRLPQPMAGLRACVFLEETETLKNSGY